MRGLVKNIKYVGEDLLTYVNELDLGKNLSTNFVAVCIIQSGLVSPLKQTKRRVSELNFTSYNLNT